jgi:hypothetical protein
MAHSGLALTLGASHVGLARGAVERLDIETVAGTVKLAIEAVARIHF